MQSAQQLAQQLWGYCKYMRDDGVAALDYLPQLAMLLFLKMANERSDDSDATSSMLVARQWTDLCSQDESQLLAHYSRVLRELGDQPGVVGGIFRDAQPKLHRPAVLARLLREIDVVRWVDIDHDVLAEAYESILGKTTDDVKSGAGQYFTPKSLIQAIVDVLRPELGQCICDPACGTGGFLIEARKYLLRHYQLSSEQRHKLQYATFSGGEIVEETARLCLMNLLLNDIGGQDSDVSPISVGDSLRSVPRDRVDVVYCNPPFGQERGGLSLADHKRLDFCCKTGNKQLNFVQHVVSLLKPGGRAAIVVPDNVLFASGTGEKIRRWLLTTCDVHTLLRLPTGIFYAQGVKANVLFFQKRPPIFEPWTTRLWVYDLRTDSPHYTLRTNALTRADLENFVQSFRVDAPTLREESDRFQSYTYEELIKREKCNLDIFRVRRAAHRDASRGERVSETAQSVSSSISQPDSSGEQGRVRAKIDPERVEEAMRSFRVLFPRGSRIYVSVASETPLLVKFYAPRGTSILCIDWMLSQFIPTFRLVRSKLVSGLFAPDRGILHDDTDTVLFLVDEIGRRVWQDSNAYCYGWLPE